MGIFGELVGFLGRYSGSIGADDGDEAFDLLILRLEAGKG